MGQITVRLSDRHYAFAEQQAALLGYAGPGEYIATLISAQAAEEAAPAKDDDQSKGDTCR